MRKIVSIIISPPEEVQRMEQNLVEIGLQKAGYYSSAMHTGNISTTQSITGVWDWRDGLICITESNVSGAFNNGHGGIMGVAPDYYCTYEANPGTGVSTKDGNYPNRFSGKNVWQVGVTNTTVAQDAAAAQWARNQIGQPYGFPVALSNRSKFYCSHLVYAAHKDVTGVNLDTSVFPGFIHPFELFASPETTVTYLRYLHEVTF